MIPIFQSEDYYHFLSDTGLFAPFRFSVSHGGRDVGILQGYIQKDGGALKRFLSRRAIVNGGPFWSEDALPEDKLQLLKKAVAGVKESVIYLSLIHI